MTNGWKRVTAIVALALLGAGAVLLGAGTAVAIPATGVSAGEFCGKDDHYEFRIADNGTSVQCLPAAPSQTWRWKASNPPPVNPPPGVLSVSTSPGASTSASATGSSAPVAPASSSSAPATVPAAVDNDELALTGVPVGLIAVCGGVLLVSGAAAVFITRRRRTEYRA